MVYLVETNTVQAAGHVDNAAVYTIYLSLFQSGLSVKLSNSHSCRQGRWNYDGYYVQGFYRYVASGDSPRRL